MGYEDAEAAYSKALEPLAVGVFDANVPGAYNSHFKAMANQQEGGSLQAPAWSGSWLAVLQAWLVGWLVVPS
jgi:hypothetical protein